MPISPEKRKAYPKDWGVVSGAIRARAGGRCECTGECGHDHAAEPFRSDRRSQGPRCEARNREAHPVTGSLVILTTAHLWRGPCAEHHARGEKCGDPAHLKAMCNRCHLAYDLPHHQANARATRFRRKATGDLFEGGTP